MPELSLDFGLLIAYFVPGFIVLFGLRYRLYAVRKLLTDIDRNEHRVISTFSVVVLAIVLGMMVSILRYWPIDESFEWPIRYANVAENPHFGAIQREDPAYKQFVEEGPLNALLLAEKNDKRPYQFYGNTLLAIAFYCLAWVTKEPRKQSKAAWNRRARIAGLALAVSAAILYPAARLSYYRYNRAVKDLNTRGAIGEGPVMRL